MSQNNYSQQNDTGENDQQTDAQTTEYQETKQEKFEREQAEWNDRYKRESFEHDQEERSREYEREQAEIVESRRLPTWGERAQDRVGEAARSGWEGLTRRPLEIREENKKKLLQPQKTVPQRQYPQRPYKPPIGNRPSIPPTIIRMFPNVDPFGGMGGGTGRGIMLPKAGPNTMDFFGARQGGQKKNLTIFPKMNIGLDIKGTGPTGPRKAMDPFSGIKKNAHRDMEKKMNPMKGIGSIKFNGKKRRWGI